MTKPAPAPNAEQFQACAEALRRAMVPAVQRMADQAKALHAAMTPTADGYERNPAPLTVRPSEPGSCQCACGTHPEFPGTCRGDAEPGHSIVANSPTTGPWHVPLCRNCHDIRMGLAPQRASDLEAVTETCTCHCRANHPGRPGICEAASEDGVTIDDKPACLECADASRARSDG
ncbi:hypothetical protein [Streptomyces sp. NPDC047525]|uniref:hypothetical protein n=1 Tax=Streptomyces sp. NPDC047525 TaxID=3155264 RepID=UPI0033C3F90A